MDFKIPFGKQQISLSIADTNVISFKYRDNSAPDFKKEEDLITDALRNPVSSPRLSELVYGKKDVCILASDITRPCPSYKFLPHLVEELKKAGIVSIKIVFGLGIHRPHTHEEKVKLAGTKAAGECQLIDFDKNKCRHIGYTSYGTPVEVSEEVIKSKFKIATGNIEYHYFAGYSGGAKALLPGVCSYNSICANHSMMLEESANAGEFYGNPVRQDIEEAGRMAKIDFIFNVVLDDNKKVIGAVAGKNNEAMLAGINLYDSIYETSCAEKADIVITSAGGYPKDINLYQAQKALDNVKGIVKGGGTIVLVAECSEGFGEDKFAEWMQESKDFEGLFRKIKQKFIIGGHKAVAISKLLTRANVLLYSNFDHSTTDNMGFTKVDDIESFINGKLSENKGIRIAVVPNGRFIKYCL